MVKFSYKIKRTKVQIKKLIKYPYQTFSILVLFQVLQHAFLSNKKFYSGLDFGFLNLDFKIDYPLFNVIIFFVLFFAYFNDVNFFIKNKLKWTLQDDILHHCFVSSWANLFLSFAFLVLILFENKISENNMSQQTEFFFQILLSYYTIFLTFVVSIHVSIVVNKKYSNKQKIDLIDVKSFF